MHVKKLYDIKMIVYTSMPAQTFIYTKMSCPLSISLLPLFFMSYIYSMYSHNNLIFYLTQSTQTQLTNFLTVSFLYHYRPNPPTKWNSVFIKQNKRKRIVRIPLNIKCNLKKLFFIIKAQNIVPKIYIGFRARQGSHIRISSDLNYLGLTLNKVVTWGPHLKKKRKTLNSRLHLLWRIFKTEISIHNNILYISRS